MSSARLIRSLTDMLGMLSRGRFAEKCDEHLNTALETLKAIAALAAEGEPEAAA